LPQASVSKRSQLEAIAMKTIFYFQINKTHSHKKGFALGLILKVGLLELGNDPGEVKTAIKRLQNGKLPVIDSIQGPK